MAATTSTEFTPVKEKEMNNHMSDLEKIDNEEELDTKLNMMSKLGFSIGNWMKVLFNRDTSQEEFNPVWLSFEEYKAQADESMQNAWRVINMSDWKVEKKGTKGDIVESKLTDIFGKVYKFTGIVDCPAKFLFEDFKNNLTRIPEWNPTVLKSELIKEIGPGIDISYQVTAGGGRGIIAPRDFVILRRAAALTKDGRVVEGDEEPHCYISSGVSVQVPGFPPNKDIVRGHNRVGCWYIRPTAVKNQNGQIEQKAIFQWLMSCDLKGKIPQFVLDTALATVMLDYVVHVRKHAADAKAKGLF